MDLETLLSNEPLLDQVCRDIAEKATRDRPPSMAEPSDLTPDDLLRRLVSNDLCKTNRGEDDQSLSRTLVDVDLIVPGA